MPLEMSALQRRILSARSDFKRVLENMEVYHGKNRISDCDTQDDGQIPLPGEIRKKFGLKPNQKITVIIEVPQVGQKKKSYSFGKVRKLLESIEGGMGAEIIADRKDRI